MSQIPNLICFGFP